MEQLTQMELLQASELLGALELAMKKAMVYGERFQDGELKELCEQAADRHREQVGNLLAQVRRHSGRPDAAQH